MSDANPSAGTDLGRVEDKLDALAAQVADLHRTQQMLASLYEDMIPVATTAMHTASVRLADLEQKGYFDFARESMSVLDHIVQGFTPDDVHALAENVVHILDAVKRATQPEVLAFATETADHLEDEAERKPKGIVSMMRHGAKDEDVRRGLAVVMEALRQVGRTANPERRAMREKWGVAAPRQDPATAAPRAAAPRAAAPRAAPARAAPGAPAPAPSAAAAPSAADAPAAAALFAGLQVDAEGFVLDSTQWTEAFATEAAALLGLELDDRHWEVLRFIREEFKRVGGAPNIRRITIGAGIQTRDLFTLFPRAPAKTAARIAGVPKPVGCV